MSQTSCDITLHAQLILQDSSCLKILSLHKSKSTFIEVDELALLGGHRGCRECVEWQDHIQSAPIWQALPSQDHHRVLVAYFSYLLLTIDQKQENIPSWYFLRGNLTSQAISRLNKRASCWSHKKHIIGKPPKFKKRGLNLNHSEARA
ncbi:hypothetical protein ACJX0J_040619 [Zea mays]